MQEAERFSSSGVEGLPPDPGASSTVADTLVNAAEPLEEIMRELAAKLDPASHVPLYQQILEQIENCIRNGPLLPGDQLISERRMTELFGVSRRTVRAALGGLIERKYISATHGRGNFVLQPPTQGGLQLLALDRFVPNQWNLLPRHYDMIHNVEAEGNVSVHYKYIPDLDKFRKIVAHPPSGHDGILIVRPNQEWVDELVRIDNGTPSPIPLLVVNRDLTGTGLNFVSSDHFQGARSATLRLIAAGHRRIGYISGSLAHDYMRRTFDGYRDALEGAGLESHAEDCIYCDTFDRGQIEGLLGSFLSEYRFTAAVVAGSVVAVPFERTVQRSGLIIPDQLSAILICEQHVYDKLTMRWAAYVYPDESVILRSFQVLSELSLGQIRPPVQELQLHQIHEGATAPGALTA